MQTTFNATVKGWIMESIFDNCDSFLVKHYNNLSLKADEEFEDDKSYQYEISIRHNEGEKARKIFEKEVKAREGLLMIP